MLDTFNLQANLNPGTLRDVLSLRMGSSVAGTIRARVKDARLAQMLDHFIQYVGSSPYGSPAVLCAIAHMQAAEGVWYPMGGTRAVADGAARARGRARAASSGPGEEVDRPAASSTAPSPACGPPAARREPVDAVVSNMDAMRTYRELVGGAAARRYDRKGFEPACSGVVLYLGPRPPLPHLAHHDFVFSRDPEEEFDWIYKRGEPAPDPTCYLAAPAATDPERGAARAARRSTCWSTRPTCGRTTTGGDVPGLPAGRSSTS